MLLCDEALSLRLALGRIAGMVAANNLEHTAIDAALGIDLSDSKVNTAQNVLADGGVSAGHGIDGADLNRSFISHGKTNNECCEHCNDAQNGNELLHVRPPKFVLC